MQLFDALFARAPLPNAGPVPGMEWSSASGLLEAPQSGRPTHRLPSRKRSPDMAMLDSVCPASWRAEPAGGDDPHHGQAIEFVSVKGLQHHWQIEFVRVKALLIQARDYVGVFPARHEPTTVAAQMRRRSSMVQGTPHNHLAAISSPASPTTQSCAIPVPCAVGIVFDFPWLCRERRGITRSLSPGERCGLAGLHAQRRAQPAFVTAQEEACAADVAMGVCANSGARPPRPPPELRSDSRR
jgi:hypothetical protein